MERGKKGEKEMKREEGRVEKKGERGGGEKEEGGEYVGYEHKQRKKDKIAGAIYHTSKVSAIFPCIKTGPKNTSFSLRVGKINFLTRRAYFAIYNVTRLRPRAPCFADFFNAPNFAH